MTDKTPHYAFFQNVKCEKFPCHTGVPAEEFNCLFCYCPLYTLGPRCGGDFVYLANGIKSCEVCTFPHWRGHYRQVLDHFRELADLARRPEETP